jgi:hypothetical protein
MAELADIPVPDSLTLGCATAIDYCYIAHREAYVKLNRRALFERPG